MKRSVAIVAASAALLACTNPTLAFSKLGREDGSVAEGDGVVSTPLPPLEAPAAGEPAATAQGQTGASETPAGDAAAQPAPPNASPNGEPASPTPGTGSAPAPAADGSTPNAATPLGPETPSTTPSPDGSAGAGAGATDNEPEPEGTDPAASQQAVPREPSGPPPDVVYGDNALPEPVRELRAKLLDAAKSGDIEKLRPFIQSGEDGTVLSFGGIEGDPIEYLKSSSGDGEGVETMAIMLEVLESGHIRNEPGTENEIYVWPYFAGLQIGTLTKPQKVELFELITAGDYQEMTAFGAYNFYRIGITPDGKLQFFVAGD